MKQYKMPQKDMAKGLCWKYALACILEIHPSKVPNFVTDKSKDDNDRTRAWLRKKFNKSILYIPINAFYESEDSDRRNPMGGPEGYSILEIETEDENSNHVAIAKDGKFFFNSCNNEWKIFKHPIGFYIIHDL